MTEFDATARPAAFAFSLWTAAAKPAPAHRLRPSLLSLPRVNGSVHP